MVLSVIIPARNEERLIEQTVQHALDACRYFASHFQQDDQIRSWEVIVVDNQSTDRTRERLQKHEDTGMIKMVSLQTLGAARARNAGRQHSRGEVLVFIDADTLVPIDALYRIMIHCRDRQLAAGITALGQLEAGVRAWLWWTFWNQVRRLPIARAKAMPAFMFCTSTTFDTFGPFDESVAIGEEWPILAGLYRHQRQNVIYDRSIVARSSSRRMNHGRFGYTRTFFKYVWAILHFQGRVHYSDTIR
jgi:glycosyltransferase involved in cell wall biosynthesis